MKQANAFTLIELLIVVAIIAILAAIAVPNFLEAQVRSKVSRVRADQRTIATGLEAYYVDSNAYPPEDLPSTPGFDGAIARGEWSLQRLTTPIAYLTSIPDDPFIGSAAPLDSLGNPIPAPKPTSFFYADYMSFIDLRPGFSPQEGRFRGWGLSSLGPDRDNDGGVAQGWRLVVSAGDPNRIASSISQIYDPTNGTVSSGDINRFGGEAAPLAISNNSG